MNDQDGIEIPETSTPTLPDAAEIVLPPDSVVGGAMQFARTPFIASFQAGWLKINLATVHIYFGSGASGLERRKEEIRRLTELLAERAKSERDSDADAHCIALGDFNIVDREHATTDALVSNGFEIPEALQRVPGSNVKQDKFYDQIALWRGRSRRPERYTQMRPLRAGVFDFFDVVYRREEEETYRPFMRKPRSAKCTRTTAPGGPTRCPTICRCGSSCRSTLPKNILPSWRKPLPARSKTPPNREGQGSWRESPQLRLGGTWPVSAPARRSNLSRVASGWRVLF